MALYTDIFLLDADTVAVLVAHAGSGAVVAHPAKVAATFIGQNAVPMWSTALGAYRDTLPSPETIMGYFYYTF